MSTSTKHWVQVLSTEYKYHEDLYDWTHLVLDGADFALRDPGEVGGPLALFGQSLHDPRVKGVLEGGVLVVVGQTSCGFTIYSFGAFFVIENRFI